MESLKRGMYVRDGWRGGVHTSTCIPAEHFAFVQGGAKASVVIQCRLGILQTEYCPVKEGCCMSTRSTLKGEKSASCENAESRRFFSSCSSAHCQAIHGR